MARLYKGISFKNFIKNKSIRVYDVELVKRDILNHLFTSKGERIKMVDYGSIIVDLLFDQLDTITLTAIRDDLINIIGFEPRVRLDDIKIVPLFDQHTVFITLTLYYVELNLTDNLDINLIFNT